MPKPTARMSSRDKAVLRQWFKDWYRRRDVVKTPRVREVYAAAMALLRDEDEEC